MGHRDQMRRAFTEEGVSHEARVPARPGQSIEEINAVAEEAEAQSMMTSLGHEMLGLLAFREGRLEDARDHFARSLDPEAAEGLWGRPAAMRWETGMRLADVQWLHGQAREALASACRTFEEVPAERKHSVAYQIAKMCTEAERSEDAPHWLKAACGTRPIPSPSTCWCLTSG